jgi:hypothetical protein
MNTQNSFELGKSFLLTGDYLNASAQFSQTLNIDAADNWAWFLKGLSVILAGHYSEGVNFCRKASFSSNEDIVSSVTKIFRNANRDISSDFVKAGKTLVQEQQGGRYLGNILHEVLIKILAEKENPLYKGLQLKRISYSGMKFVLSYQDSEYDSWVIQVFQDLFRWGFPYTEKTPSRHLLSLSEKWHAVNLKIPPKRNNGVRSGSILIEMPYIVPKDIDLTPDIVISYGFDFDKWKSISLHETAWPKCYLPYADMSREEVKLWMDNNYRRDILLQAKLFDING